MYNAYIVEYDRENKNYFYIALSLILHINTQVHIKYSKDIKHKITDTRVNCQLKCYLIQTNPQKRLVNVSYVNKPKGKMFTFEVPPLKFPLLIFYRLKVASLGL